MLLPGTYQATAEVGINRYRRNGENNAPSLIDYFTVAAGETFEIPKTFNGFYYAPCRDPFDPQQPVPIKRIS